MAKHKENGQKLLIAFDQTQAAYANMVAERLERDGYAQTLEINECLISLQVSSKIAINSALVFVSDKAVKNPEWQRMVRQLEDNIHLIPIGSTETVDYNNPEVIPPRIEAVNFIRKDEFMMENIIESLMTDPKFYEKKNSLQSKAEQWERSNKLDENLLNNVKETEYDLNLITDKLHTETEPYFVEQLEQISLFLTASLKYSKRFRQKQIIQNSRRICAAVVVAIMILLIIIIRPYIDRIYNCSYSLAYSDTDYFPEVTAMKMLEILTNPFINSKEVKNKARSLLLSTLDKSWEFNIIGNDYAWALTDLCITSESDYLWTSDDEGAIMKWNRSNGEIVSHEVVSEKGLDYLSINKQGTIYGAIDRDHTLFVKSTSVSNEWRRCDFDFDFVPCGVVTSEKDNTVSVIGKSDICIIDVGENINVISDLKFEEVFNVVASDGNGFFAVVQNGDKIQFITINYGDITDSSEIPKQISTDIAYTNKVAISTSRQVVLLDEQAELVVWNYDEPDQLKHTGIICFYLTDVKFLNEQTVVFSDRNWGTHLLDIVKMIDLGQIMTMSESINRLAVAGNQVAGKTNADIHSQDVTDLLPLKSLEGQEVIGSFDSSTCSCETGIVRSVKIISDYLILARILINNEEKTVIMDGSCKLSSGSDQVNSAFLENIDPGYLILKEDVLVFSGKPTVVGIMPDGYTVLIGSADGTFHELRFTQSGTAVTTSTRKEFASKSPVKKIFYLHESYIILDTGDNLWKFRQATNLLTVDDYINVFKEKNHMVFGEDLLKTVSADLIERLNLEVVPLHGDETWVYEP